MGVFRGQFAVLDLSRSQHDGAAARYHNGQDRTGRIIMAPRNRHKKIQADEADKYQLEIVSGSLVPSIANSPPT